MRQEYQGAKEMATQASNGWRVPRGRSSSTGAAVLDRPAIAPSMTPADDRLQQEMFRLLEASRAVCLREGGGTGQRDGNSRQLRALAQTGARKVEELITQTYLGNHEKMKLAVDNIAIALQGLQMEMARLTDASHEAQLAERGQPGQFPGIQKLKERLLMVLDPERTVNLAIKRVA
jgi:predicted Rdx family selenoprotein